MAATCLRERDRGNKLFFLRDFIFKKTFFEKLQYLKEDNKLDTVCLTASKKEGKI